MSSILTNNSAMVALQTLKSINSNLFKTQDEISTGKSVAKAKDNSAIWAISKVMESDVSGFKAISDSLDVGESTVAVASAGAESVVETLKEMKALIVAAQSETADRTKIEASLAQKTDQITSIIDASQFNGVNLLKGVGGTDDLHVLSSMNRVGAAAPTPVKITVVAQDFDNAINIGGRTSITDTATAATALTEIEAFLTTAITSAATLGASAKRITDQNVFVGKLTDAMKGGIGALVDADMEEASSRLQALQTQQQLGVQALSIANQQPQTLLSLFR